MAVEGSRSRRGRGSREGGAEPSDTEDVFIIRALARGLRVLSLFTVDHPEWGLNELSRRTGLHKATTYRITRTMESEGYLVFDPETNLYHLGPAIIPASYVVRTHSELSRIAHPYLEELARETGETANLAVEIEGSMVLIDQVMTSHPFKPTLPIGRVLGGLANSHGKVLAVYRSEAERKAMIAAEQRAHTKNTITDPKELTAVLETVARDGVAFDLEELNLGVCAVAAPVVDQTGDLRATVAVVAPTDRFGPEARAAGAEATKRAGLAISERLGFVAG
ncbi:MAG: IclR family transcriptional regulator [Thermoleophilia bacterium]